MSIINPKQAQIAYKQIPSINTDISSIINSSILMPPPKAMTKTTNKTMRTLRDFLGKKRELSTQTSTISFPKKNVTSISSCFFFMPEHQCNIQHENRNFSKKFQKLPAPNSNEDINLFVNNLIDYLDYMINNLFLNKNNKNIDLLKTKIQVRYQDFLQGGLNYDYFVLCLMRMQKELISFICLYDIDIVSSDNDKD